MKIALASRVSATLSLLALAGVALGQPSFTPLGIPAGGIASFGYGVSAEGSIVVGTAVDSLFNFRPWRWTAPTGTVLMPLLNGYNAGTADGLSADGAVAVGSAVQQQLDQWQACTYTLGGSVVIGIGDLPGGDFYSSAAAISADGRVIVGTGDSEAFPSRAFRHVAGVMHELGALPGGEWSDAYAVSAGGSVIVGSSENDNFDFEAFRWTQAAGMVGLGIPAGSFESEALGVSGDGAVALGHHLDFDGVYHAFRWTQAGGMQTLATLPGYLGGSARAANQDGSIIVGSLYDDLNRPRAMIWDAQHGPRLLQQVLEDSGLWAPP